jgi:formamidopyrimidine-DNA glycosylase
VPELPEVETIKKEVAPFVVGHKILAVDVLWDGMVKQPSVAEFLKKVTGRTITGLTRRGKYLFFHLDKGDDVLLMHMKMTGSLLINPEKSRFTRAILHLDKGTDVHFADARKFGKMWLEKNENAVIDKLGPEPIDEDFTAKTLADILKKRTAPVKAVILDQALISGIGNMYADEALFDSRIHPARPADKLSPAEVKRLYTSIRKVLLRGIEMKGASVRDYTRPSGEPGRAHDEFIVAHGVGNKCPGCRGNIERIVVRGRGTYICPHCQPLK